VAAVGWRWTPGIYGAVGGRHESYGVTFGEIRRVARRFAVFALLLFLAVVIARPEHFLDWPRHRPFTWLAVMMAYPLASVVPQEMLYRGVIFGRIQAFGGSDRTAVWLSAVSFSALHAIYGNVCAVVLTLIGGWFFADTYRRTRSLPLVCVEHALYGNLIFTIGLGDCFSNLPAVA
jgi:membrane protease YdiL (CAAX protease family)